MKLHSLCLVAAVAAASLPAHAATVAGWDFEALSTTATTTAPVVAASIGVGSATGMHVGAATYSAPAGNASTKSFSANTWVAGDYWQFGLSTVGYTGVTLSFDQAGSSTGPHDFTLEYSTNGTTFTSFANYGVVLNAFSATVAQPSAAQTFDLSSIAALNGQASVTFRLVDADAVSISGGAVAAAGTDRVDNFLVMATPAVPEPETYALMAAGLGAVGFMAKRRKA